MTGLAKLLALCLLLLVSHVRTADARFLTPDTWDPWLQAVDINRYAYSNNDPINLSDPNGHSYGSDTVGGSPDNVNGKNEGCERKNSCGSYNVHRDAIGDIDDIIDQNGSFQQNYDDYLRSAPAVGALFPEPGHIVEGRQKLMGAIGASLATQGYPNASSALEAGNGVVAPKVTVEGSTARFPTIQTPYGTASQSLNYSALKARSAVQKGATLFRIGKTGKSSADKAQFWSLQNPLTTPDYAKGFGIPAQNAEQPDFIQGGKINPGTDFVTRPAPGIGANTGGQIEVVVPPGGVRMNFFSRLR